MHLVLAQYTRHPGGPLEVVNIDAQLRKSIALALKDARRQKKSMVVISSNIPSSQDCELFGATEFAELLKEVLLEDLKQNPAEQFQCVCIAVQSRQQCEIYNRCFEK